MKNKNTLNTKEQNKFDEQLAIIKKSTDETLERASEPFSSIDLSQIAKLGESYRANITPGLVEFSKAFEKYHKMSK